MCFPNIFNGDDLYSLSIGKPEHVYLVDSFCYSFQLNHPRFYSLSLVLVDVSVIVVNFQKSLVVWCHGALYSF